MLRKTAYLAAFLAFSWAAACTTKKVACVEKIDPACICPADYDPVCGCNDKTYSNACAAECAGIREYKKGECPPK